MNDARYTAIKIVGFPHWLWFKTSETFRRQGIFQGASGWGHLFTPTSVTVREELIVGEIKSFSLQNDLQAYEGVVPAPEIYPDRLTYGELTAALQDTGNKVAIQELSSAEAKEIEAMDVVNRLRGERKKLAEAILERDYQSLRGLLRPEIQLAFRDDPKRVLVR